MFSSLTAFFRQNWLLIMGGVLFLFLILLLLFWLTKEEKVDERFIFCPLRQRYFPKCDSQGRFSEEYQRIRLISYFLKKGYSRSALHLEYPLEKSFGHKGQSKVKILVDLLLIKNDRCWIVVEVKKSYRPEWKKSAIEHQLKPAMEWTRSKYGIYWDGTGESCCLIKQGDGTVRIEKFPP